MLGLALKVLISLNTLYFAVTCLVTMRSGTLIQTKLPYDDDTIKHFMNSPLVEEFGLIAFILSGVLALTALVFKMNSKVIWTLIASLPLATALALLFYIKYIL